MHATEPSTPPMDKSIDAPKRQRRFAGINDIMMRCTTTGFIFLVSFVGFTVFFSLFLVPIIVRDHVPDYWSLLTASLTVLLIIGSTFLLSRSTWKRHASSEKKERRFSMLAGAYWGYMLALLYLFIFPYNVSYILGFFILLPLIGICMGIKIPIYGCPALWHQFVKVIVLCFIIILPLWFLTVILGLRNVHYQAEHFPRGLSALFSHDYAMIMQDTIPNGVTDIDLESEFLGFWGKTYDWSCRLSEANFIAFAEEHNYLLVEKFDTKDKDTEERIGRLLRTLHGTVPTHYWIHEGHYERGGLLLLYDRTTGILHGFYIGV